MMKESHPLAIVYRIHYKLMKKPNASITNPKCYTLLLSFFFDSQTPHHIYFIKTDKPKGVPLHYKPCLSSQMTLEESHVSP